MTDGVSPSEEQNPAAAPVVDANQLLGARGVLSIVHAGETYQLRRTKQNKLLLTKCCGERVFGGAQNND